MRSATRNNSGSNISAGSVGQARSHIPAPGPPWDRRRARRDGCRCPRSCSAAADSTARAAKRCQPFAEGSASPSSPAPGIAELGRAPSASSAHDGHWKPAVASARLLSCTACTENGTPALSRAAYGGSGASSGSRTASSPGGAMRGPGQAACAAASKSSKRALSLCQTCGNRSWMSGKASAQDAQKPLHEYASPTGALGPLRAAV